MRRCWSSPLCVQSHQLGHVVADPRFQHFAVLIRLSAESKNKHHSHQRRSPIIHRVYAGILKSNVIPFKTFFKTLSIHFKTSSPLWVLTGYLGDTLYLTLTIYSVDCPSSLSSNHLDADLHFPITMLFNHRRKRTFARYQAVSVRCPVQMTSNPTGCHK